GGRARGMDRLTHLSGVSDFQGFVLALPNGVDKQWNDGRGIEKYTAHRESVDDVGFIASLIEEAARRAPIDRSRVYVTGMSNGGLMAHRLACEIPEKIVAIAAVEGLISQLTAKACPGKIAVPMLLIKGSDAPTFEKTSVRLSALETAKFWARINGCQPAPGESWLPDQAPDDGTKTRRVEFRGCAGGADVVWLDVQGGGHTWPGGYQYLPEFTVGRTSRDFGASETIWEFFKSRSRQGRPRAAP
ncbi:MAG: alpha/beta hydrolase family esterase, partial [Gammaproteobacteria bacterium]